jgi:uncharacterized protein YggT (Ycf19 family)
MIERFLAALINVFVGVAEVLLALRVLLRLFGANPDVDFVQWVYTSSGVLLDPFRGIFEAKAVAANSVIDFSALFAMLVYGLVGMLFLMLVARMTMAPMVASKKR